MYMPNGRGMQVGRGDNRPLGFYGVGRLADAGQVAIPACDPTNDFNCLMNLGSETFTPLPSGQAAVTQTNYGAQAPASSNTVTYLLVVAGVVGLMVMLKR